MKAWRATNAAVVAVVTASLGVPASQGAPLPDQDAPVSDRAVRATVQRVDPSPIGVLVATGPAAGSHGGLDLYRYTDGGFVRITHNAYDPETDFQPSSFGANLSPDGARLAYVHCALENDVSVCRPHVMNSDGTDDVVLDDPALITPPGGFDFDFGGGGEIAYASEGVLYAFSPTSGRRTISNDPDHYWQKPSWNPDGTALAVVGLPTEADGSPSYAAADIWSIGADGSGAVNLSNTPHTIFTLTDDDPLWSSDGSQISWVNESEYGGDKISVSDADGANRRVLNVEYGPYYPSVRQVAWSRSSAHLAYLASGRFGYVRPNIWSPQFVELLDLPEGFGVNDWAGEPTAADVSVKIRGYRDDARVGEAEPVSVTVTNRGPAPAVGIILSAKNERGTLQTWVRWRGAHRGWECRLSYDANLSCYGRSLAVGASVTVELGILAVRRSDAAPLTVAASAKSRDLPGNNRRGPVQVIEGVDRPPPPDRDPSGWYRVGRRHDFWVRADDVVYEEPSPDDRLPGFYGATLWGWAPHEQVFRLRFKNQLCPPGATGPCYGDDLGGGDCLFGRRDHCHTIVGDYVWSRQNRVQRAMWRFFRGNATNPLPAVSYRRDLPR